MAWIWLLLAGAVEVISVPLLKEWQRRRQKGWAAAAIAALALSVYALSQSLSSIPVGTAYAVWTGIGSTGAIATGIFLYGESVNPLKLACMVLIVMGMVGLKLTS
ncbi:DMT family transporter [Paenibacillus sp. URB8-2]|uniref:DMT family transporter n=1 Tax=Paenibacillus sp. URB8-2 TaxID=2741301 RepID=UPI0015B7C4D6|nr:multidrug efflux SMR transporter [Paenibacillus sp. URB8-2]BCG60515.1 SugE protein [Paenibacillus sp. URB8-2]